MGRKYLVTYTNCELIPSILNPEFVKIKIKQPILNKNNYLCYFKFERALFMKYFCGYKVVKYVD